ncbi:HAD-like domain-containing protein [Artemisia annua]|uniref:HAD-like domain-containing protein n=1 Tax=Artemisia annua TaxID=35608 RepID=A0A2U1L337_ARTAN|nr:HAD-like domain-containing protein [Artemisia annua]
MSCLDFSLEYRKRSGETEIMEVGKLKRSHSGKTTEAKIYRKWIAKNVRTNKPTGFCCMLIDKEARPYENKEQEITRNMFSLAPEYAAVSELDEIYEVQGFPTVLWFVDCVHKPYLGPPTKLQDFHGVVVFPAEAVDTKSEGNSFVGALLTNIVDDRSVLQVNNGSYADMSVDKQRRVFRSGSGLLLNSRYYHGFFNAAINLPVNFTSGAILAFYQQDCDSLNFIKYRSVCARDWTGGVSFATCSADGTIRLWHLALQSVSTESRLGELDFSYDPWPLSSLLDDEHAKKNIETSGIKWFNLKDDRLLNKMWLHGSNVWDMIMFFRILALCHTGISVEDEQTEIDSSAVEVKSIIFDRLGDGGRTYQHATTMHLENYAEDGLRTMAFAYRKIKNSEYEEWISSFAKAKSIIGPQRKEKLETVSETIEKELVLLGAVAVDEKLQDRATFGN